MLNVKDIEKTIIEHVARILSENGRTTSGIEVNALLTEGVGLDSLGVATLFIALEDEFGVDPFDGRFSLVEMRTIADLSRAYVSALTESVSA